MIDALTIQDFSQLEAQTIEIRFGDTLQAAEIIETSTGQGRMPDGRQPFSVTLRSGPGDRHWPQGTYTLTHPQRGDLDLFMVPIGPDEHGMRYQISFS